MTILSIFGASWASGINAYLVFFILGIMERTGLSHVNEVLARTDLLIIAGIFALIEIVAEKIPYFDSIWDVVHTPIRVAAGAALGVLLSGGNVDLSDLPTIFYAATGGAVALTAHVLKTSVRLGFNSSPEPFSNIALSVVEDLFVALLVVLAILQPVIAIILAVISGIILIILSIISFKAIKKTLRFTLMRIKQRRLRLS